MIVNKKPYFEDNEFCLFKGDSFRLIKGILDKSVDLIFIDPPYFLSNGGVTVRSGKMTTVNKAYWDENMSQKKKLKYYEKILAESYRILKPDGTIWISGTFHNIYYVGVALENIGYKIINNVTWRKLNPPPNITRKAFTHSTETLIWAKKKESKKYTFNYEYMKSINNNKQMKDVWDFPLTKKSEKTNGYFPTQKPIDLLNRVILASSNPNDLVLDFFNGSGTTGISCILNNRRYIGIDRDKEYLDLSIKRYKSLKETK